MFKLPARVWTQFSTILGLPGTEGLTGVQSEVVPTQELSRILQANRVKNTMYLRSAVIAVTGAVAIDWNDASEWSSVTVNGIRTTLDADLPQPGDDRIVVAIGLDLAAGGGAVANYTNGQLNRLVDTTSGNISVPIVTTGDLLAGMVNVETISPTQLPSFLVPGELQCNFVEVVTGAVQFFWMVQMISAEPGVMAAYSGV